MHIISTKPRVLFLCTHNSARSQMAEALLRFEAGNKFEVFSAGTAPTRVHPLALQVMWEVGIDMTWQSAKSIDAVARGEFAYAITVCDRVNESCPTLPGDTLRIHWSFEDPTAAFGSDELRLQAFRRVRDEIRQRLRTFINLTCHRISLTTRTTESGDASGASSAIKLPARRLTLIAEMNAVPACEIPRPPQPPTGMIR